MPSGDLPAGCRQAYGGARAAATWAAARLSSPSGAGSVGRRREDPRPHEHPACRRRPLLARCEPDTRWQGGPVPRRRRQPLRAPGRGAVAPGPLSAQRAGARGGARAVQPLSRSGRRRPAARVAVRRRRARRAGALRIPAHDVRRGLPADVACTSSSPSCPPRCAGGARRRCSSYPRTTTTRSSEPSTPLDEPYDLLWYEAEEGRGVRPLHAPQRTGNGGDQAPERVHGPRRSRSHR